MEDRKYYSLRTGRAKETKIDLPLLRKLFYGVYSSLNNKHFFQQAFGYYCVDDGFIPGICGEDIETYFFLKLRKVNLWPIKEHYATYTEDDIFDLIELLYDLVSAPVDGYFHSWNQCGWHFNTFDKETGRQKFRSEVNDFLVDYKEGYELSLNGEVLIIGYKGIETLLQADIPNYDVENVDKRLEAAILKFRRHRSTVEERKEAVRALADILEFLRPKLKEFLVSSDENDLFNIANNFGIRHHNPKQKTNYDQPIWLSWMFYFYLATIHAVIRLIKKMES